jgi:hypothetical protein
MPCGNCKHHCLSPIPTTEQTSDLLRAAQAADSTFGLTSSLGFRWSASHRRTRTSPELPPTMGRVTGLLFEIYVLICSGAKGTRTPGLLHAIHDESVRIVRTGQDGAGQTHSAVWQGLETTGVGWARSHLVSHWLQADRRSDPRASSGEPITVVQTSRPITAVGPAHNGLSTKV